jgi:hypothetical protein
VLSALGDLAHHQDGRWAPPITEVRDQARNVLGAGTGQVEFHRVWASPSGEVWAVGGIRDDVPQGKEDETGDRSHVAFLAHFDGKRWKLHTDQNTYPLETVWGSTDKDVWACTTGGGGCFHWDGSRLRKMGRSQGPPLSLDEARHGLLAHERWFIGRRLSYQGQFIPTEVEDLRHIRKADLPRTDPANGVGASVNEFFQVAPNDLWVVGDEGLIMHWNGRTWSGTPRPARFDGLVVHDLACTAGETRAYAAGAEIALGETSGFLLARAAGWSTLAGKLTAGAGAPARGAAAVAPEVMLRVAARTPHDVWIGGSHGGVWRWDGSALAVTSKPGRSKPQISDLLLLGGGEVWMAAGPVVIRGTGEQWTTLSLSVEGEDQPRSVRRLAGRSTSDVWAYAPSAARTRPVLVHWNGKAWIAPLPTAREEDALGTWRTVRSMAVAPDGTLWIAADTNAARLVPGHDLEAVLELPHTVQDEDQERLQGLWVASNDEVWFAGNRAIRRWTRRGGWQSQAVPGAAATEAICGGPADLWAGGPGGLLHKRREASP